MIRPLHAAVLLLGLAMPIGVQAQSAELADAIGRYGEAWASRDPARIAALHTPDSAFRLFVDGVPVARGRAAIEEAFTAILASNPSYASTVHDMRFGEDFVVIEYSIRMDPEATVELGQRSFSPTGSWYEIDAIDLIEFEDGLVSLKHTFIDAEGLHNASPKVRGTDGG